MRHCPIERDRWCILRQAETVCRGTSTVLSVNRVTLLLQHNARARIPRLGRSAGRHDLHEPEVRLAASGQRDRYPPTYQQVTPRHFRDLRFLLTAC